MPWTQARKGSVKCEGRIGLRQSVYSRSQGAVSVKIVGRMALPFLLSSRVYSKVGELEHRSNQWHF